MFGLKSNPIRALYDWTLSLADRPGGLKALLLISFVESSFFPIPPDLLLIPLVLGSPSKTWRIAFVCTLGSLGGGILGYLIGHWLWWSGPSQYSLLAQWFFDHQWLHHITEERFYNMKQLYDSHAFSIIFTAGFSPLPYKLITISSGAFNINFLLFVLASGVSRGARFFLVAALLKYFGPPMKSFIDRWFNWLTLIFCVVFVLGFWAVRFFEG